MGMRWRSVGLFVGGAVFGALVAAGLAWQREELEGWWARATAPAQAEATQVTQLAPCPGAANVAAAAAGDGTFQLVDDIAGKRPSDVDTFLAIGRQSIAVHRPRDAEVAFIMACRVAVQLRASQVAVANAKYELATHYRDVAARSDGAAGADLTSRARPMYEDALRVYTALLGKSDAKSRAAADGLASLARPAPVPNETTPLVAQGAASPAPSPPPAPPESHAIAASEPAASRPRAVAAPPVSATQRVRPAQPASRLARREDTRVLGSSGAPRVAPSFDCRMAYSRAERLICSDSELSLLDRDLGRLHARASQGAADPAYFRRRSDAQWARRERECQDRACLVRWYSLRRAQLLAELEAQNRLR